MGHPFLKFGLLVTGNGEAEHLGKLFGCLAETGACHFEVIRKVEQLRPKSSKKKKKLPNPWGNLPSKDQEIGLAAKRYLGKGAGHFLLLVDDLEYHWKDMEQETFQRYRQALDGVLANEDLQKRAGVFFLIYMLEAYYFAQADAFEKVFGQKPPALGEDGDVETIRHPKNEIKNRCRGFREIDAASRMLPALDIHHILSNKDVCSGLRTLFLWCVQHLENHGPDWLSFAPDVFARGEGRLRESVMDQLH